MKKIINQFKLNQRSNTAEKKTKAQKIEFNNSSENKKKTEHKSLTKNNAKIPDNIPHNYELLKTKRGGINLIQDGKFILHKFRPLDSGYSEFRCKKYKDPETNYKRCEAFCDYNLDDGTVRTDSGKHNHPEEVECIKRLRTVNIIKDKIKNCENTLDFNIKRTYRDLLAKAPKDTTSNYSSIYSTLYREKIKNLPNDFESFEAIPEEHEFFKTLNDEPFLIYKNNDRGILVFQSPAQAKMQYKYSEDLFLDGTFYIAPSKMAYQIFITSVKDEERNITFMTSWSFMSGKTKDDYLTVLTKINNNINNICNHDNIKGEEYEPKYTHSDYETALWSSCLSVWNNTQIKNCNFHRCNNLQKYRTSHFNQLYKNNEKIKEGYLMVKAICYINPLYVSYCLTKLSEEQSAPEFKEFIEYYKRTYAYDYQAILRSNYYGRNKNRTNNVSEGNNNKLNNLFNKKPTTIRLLFELRYEEGYYKSLFDKINEGEFMGHKKRRKSFDRQIYIDKAENYIKENPQLNVDNDKENKIGDIWFNCLKELSNYESDIIFG